MMIGVIFLFLFFNNVVLKCEFFGFISLVFVGLEILVFKYEDIYKSEYSIVVIEFEVMSIIW